MDTIIQIFSPNIIGYVILMMFAVRPLSIFLSTIGTGLSIQEKSLVGWIAPRGIVALTVSSYFASILKEAGYIDAELLTTLTFGDRKSTRLNSSHVAISYAVFCLKQKTEKT